MKDIDSNFKFHETEIAKAKQKIEALSIVNLKLGDQVKQLREMAKNKINTSTITTTT